MFDSFKKPLALTLSTVTELLDRVRATVDSAAADRGIDKVADYIVEASAFVYILGWYAIQTSKLSSVDKHRFPAELTGEFAKKPCGFPCVVR